MFSRIYGIVQGIMIVHIGLWTASGLVLSFFPVDQFQKEASTPIVFPRELEARNYASPGGIVAQAPGATEVKLKTRFGVIVYEANTENGAVFFNALSGEKQPAYGKDQIRGLANTNFIGEADLKSVRRLTPSESQAMGRTDIWRAAFDDAYHTTLYISAQSGEVVKRTTKASSIFGVLRDLHPAASARAIGEPPHPFAISLALSIAAFVLLSLFRWRGVFLRNGGGAR